MRSFDDMNRLFREMDRTFDQFRASWWNEYPAPALGLESGRPALEGGRGDALERGYGDERDREYTHTPAFDWGGDTTVSLEDEGDAYVFVMDLPGFEKEDIDLTFDDGLLSVSARHDVDVEEGSDADTYRTTRSRRVSRRIPIPKAVVVEAVTASYRNGVLEVHLPIVEGERETGHRIDIE